MSNNAELVNPDPQVVTVWSDIGCPWATLSLHTLHSAAEEKGQELVVDHRAFPLELFNNMPTPKFIVEPEIVAIASARTELGWRQWHAPLESYAVTTLPALEAVQAAKNPDVGGLRASDELDTALRAAFYKDSKCISIHSVILDIARDCAHVNADALAEALARGDGRADVYAQWEVAKRPEVQGSPHLFTASGTAIHNPGATYHWTNSPFKGGLPRLEKYDPIWAEALCNEVDTP